MRWLIRIVLTVLVLTAIVWLGGETLLARRITQVAAEHPEVQLGSVTPLRSPSAIGVRITDAQVNTPDGPVTAPWLVVSAAPTAPNDITMHLPPSMTIPLNGGVSVSSTDGKLSFGVAPLKRMSVSRLGFDASNLAADYFNASTLALDHQALARDLHAGLSMTTLGFGAPASATAAYNLTLGLSDVLPGAIASVTGTSAPAITDPLSADGSTTLWFSRPVSIEDLQSQTLPPLVGLKTDGVNVKIGPNSARILARVNADAQGLASGQVFVDTADLSGFIDMAVAAGVIPPNMARLAQAAATSMGSAPQTTGTDQWPPAPAQGQVRLPLTMADGQIRLGPLGLGPAPRMLNR